MFHALCYFLTQFICWLILRLGFNLRVQGQEHVPRRGSFILASNHVSFLDPVVVGVACPRRVLFMARESLFQKPILGAFLGCVQVIPLRRGETDVSALREALKQLRQGQAVALFPEGTRQSEGSLGVAKRGVGLLAVMAKAPIIPVLVKGTFEALPPKARWLRPSKIRVAFGAPIAYTSKLSESRDMPVEGMAARAAHEQLAQAVSQQWHALAHKFRFREI